MFWWSSFDSVLNRKDFQDKGVLDSQPRHCSTPILAEETQMNKHISFTNSPTVHTFSCATDALAVVSHTHVRTHVHTDTHAHAHYTFTTYTITRHTDEVKVCTPHLQMTGTLTAWDPRPWSTGKRSSQVQAQPRCTRPQKPYSEPFVTHLAAPKVNVQIEIRYY